LSGNIKLGIAVSYWNDARCLNRCLGSLHESSVFDWFNVLWILADGKYRYFVGKGKGTTSDEETDHVINKHLEEMIFAKNFGFVATEDPKETKPFPERIKRQNCLDLAAQTKCDFVLILDSDEYLDGTKKMWSEFAEELRFIKYSHPVKYHLYGVRFVEKDKSDYYRARLIHHPEDVIYQLNHYSFNYTDEPKQALASMAIYHDPYSCRDKRRLIQNERYKKKMAYSE